MGRVSSAIPKGLLTTIGDIIAASAVGVPARIAAPASGQVLTGQGAGVLPAWAAAGGAGAGHITISPENYDSIGAGAHSFSASTARTHNVAFYSSGANLDNVSYKVYLAAGTYSIRFNLVTADNQCIMDVDIDGVEVASWDLYTVPFTNNVLKTQTGIVIAASGLKTLRIRADGKNAASAAFYYDLSGIALWRTA